MNNVTYDLMIDMMRGIRADIAVIREDIADIKAERRAMRTSDLGLMQTDVLHEGMIATLRTRVDRIERRLDLVESGDR